MFRRRGGSRLYSLVQFVEDGILKIFKNDCIREDAKGSFAPWCDGKEYPIVIFKTGDKNEIYGMHITSSGGLHKSVCSPPPFCYNDIPLNTDNYWFAAENEHGTFLCQKNCLYFNEKGVFIDNPEEQKVDIKFLGPEKRHLETVLREKNIPFEVVSLSSKSRKGQKSRAVISSVETQQNTTSVSLDGPKAGDIRKCQDDQAAAEMSSNEDRESRIRNEENPDKYFWMTQDENQPKVVLIRQVQNEGKTGPNSYSESCKDNGGFTSQEEKDYLASRDENQDKDVSASTDENGEKVAHTIKDENRVTEVITASRDGSQGKELSTSDEANPEEAISANQRENEDKEVSTSRDENESNGVVTSQDGHEERGVSKTGDEENQERSISVTQTINEEETAFDENQDKCVPANEDKNEVNNQDKSVPIHHNDNDEDHMPTSQHKSQDEDHGNGKEYQETEQVTYCRGRAAKSVRSAVDVLYASSTDDDVESSGSGSVFDPNTSSEQSTEEEEDAEVEDTEEVETYERHSDKLNVRIMPAEARRNMQEAVQNLGLGRRNAAGRDENLHPEPGHKIELATLQEKKDEKRIYDRFSICLYCFKKQAKLGRHLLRKHCNEKEVEDFAKEPLNSKARADKIQHIRDRGHFVMYVRVISEGAGVVVPSRRPTTDNKEYNNYLPCDRCFKILLKSHLARHQALYCKYSSDNLKKERNINVRRRCQSILPVAATATTDLYEKVLPRLSADQVAEVARNDSAILMYASRLFEKVGHGVQNNQYVRNKMRELARLLIAVKQVDPSICELVDCFDAKKYDTLIKAVRNISGFDTDSQLYKTPNLALKIGHSLHEITDVLRGEALKLGSPHLIEKYRSFAEVLRLYKRDVATHALRTNYLRKPKSMLPIAEDLQIYNRCLKELGSKALADLKLNGFNEVSYLTLTKVTLARIVTFNRRRTGETERLLLTSFTQRTSEEMQREVFLSLCKYERKLASTLTRIETVGKKGRKVAILLTPDLVDSLNVIVAMREQAGIKSSNPYLFTTKDTELYLRGTAIIRSIADQEELGLKYPERITSTAMRKHVATMCQVMNLDGPGLNTMADFMGHNLNVHKEYYQLPINAMQLAKVSKVLLAMEKGKMHKLKEQNLDEISANFSDSDLSEENEAEVEEGNGRSFLEDPLSPRPSTRSPVPGPSTRSSVPSPSTRSPLRGPSGGANKTTRKQAVRNKADVSEVPIKKRKILKRTPWSDAEHKAVIACFAQEIRLGTPPGKEKCEKCKRENSELLKNRSWSVIKDHVVHYYKRLTK